MSAIVLQLTRYSVHSGKKPYICRWIGCDRTFADPANWQRHEFTHLGVRPFTCLAPDCHGVFTRRASLKIHLRTIHRMDPSGPELQAALSKRKSNKALVELLERTLQEQALRLM